MIGMTNDNRDIRDTEMEKLRENRCLHTETHSVHELQNTVTLPVPHSFVDYTMNPTKPPACLPTCPTPI